MFDKSRIFFDIKENYSHIIVTFCYHACLWYLISGWRAFLLYCLYLLWGILLSHVFIYQVPIFCRWSFVISLFFNLTLRTKHCGMLADTIFMTILIPGQCYLGWELSVTSLAGVWFCYNTQVVKHYIVNTLYIVIIISLSQLPVDLPMPTVWWYVVFRFLYFFLVFMRQRTIQIDCHENVIIKLTLWWSKWFTFKYSGLNILRENQYMSFKNIN